MLIPNQQDAIHKAWLYRILIGIADDVFLPSVLYFKGGTCAAMLGWLDRFSVDLDFDYVGDPSLVKTTHQALERLFKDLGLAIKDSSKKGIQYFLGYEAPGRNTLKIDTSFPVPANNQYASQRLAEIDRILTCQTIETMFAHKLLALLGRSQNHGRIAGRDVYDIHYFFLNGYHYNPAIIQEQTNTDIPTFLKKVSKFIEQEVTDVILAEDLNYLLPASQFQRLRKVLKSEVLMLLNDEIKRKITLTS